MSYSTEVTADAPLWWGRSGEASGTTAIDASGNGHNGVYNNSPTLGVAGALSGDPDTAVSYASASSQDMRVPWFAALDLALFTLECWVKTTGANQAIIGRQGGTSAPYNMFVDSSGKLQLSIKNSGVSGSTYSGTNTINNGAWRHVAITRGSGGALAFYIDGALDFSLGSSIAPQASAAGFAVASRGGTPFLNGSVDEPALYDYALTATRIAAHYSAAGTAPPPPAITGTWGLVA